MTDDVREVLWAWRREDVAAQWGDGEVLAREAVCELVRGALACAGGDGESTGSARSDASDAEGEARDRLVGRVRAVLGALVDMGEVEQVAGEAGGEQGDVKYRRVPRAAGWSGRASRRGGRPGDVRSGAREERVSAPLVDLGVMKPENEDKQSQSALEREFAQFFEGIASEWNPCFADDGRWRYKWDEEIGAHDVEVELDEAGEAQVTSEERAVRDVGAMAPDRVNLRACWTRSSGPTRRLQRWTCSACGGSWRRW